MSTNRNNYMRSNTHVHMDPRMHHDNCMQPTPYARTCEEQIDTFPIGMAYVPWQVFRDMYDPHQGLNRGTIFKELDYPFYGKRGNCR